MMQRLWLALLLCFYFTTALAKINLNVEIKGVSGEIADNVRLFLSIEQQKVHALLSEGRLRRLHKKAPEEISQALQPFGYYRPVIETTLTQPAADQWQATYTIDPGPPLPVGLFELTVTKEMRNDPEFQILLQQLPLRKGEAFNHGKYETIKADLSRLAAERGYLDARFVKHRVEIDLEQYEARIYLHYDGGPRYRFGEVLLQQEVLDPGLLQRYIPFERGTPYTLSDLLDLQQALNDSDYFRTVEVSPGQAQADTTEIPVSVTLTPHKRHRYSLGLGYGTNTGARAKFGWAMPRLNPQGHRLNSELKLSQIGYSFGAQYHVPIRNPRTDQIIYSAAVINEKTDTSDSTMRTIGASLNRNRGAWRESVALNYQQEEYEIADERGDSSLLIPGITWSRTWGRNFIYTIDGLRFDISLRGASKNLASDTDFLQLQGGVKAITPLGANNRMITRGRLGSTWTEEFNQLPTSVRFFTGGAQSVRGYAYQSLGPLDETGQVEGGQHLMSGSIEFEHSLNDKWGAALFLDAGNAINNLGDKLEQGAGFGLRWKSPVGPVRIDLATALSREGRPWRLHINIGPDL